MIKKIDIDIVEEKDKLLEILQKTTQSANLNFLIGAGCSTPALKALGNTEQKIQDDITNGENEKANKSLFDFLKIFVESTKKLLKDNTECKDHIDTFSEYKNFILAIYEILFERKSNILHKQANIFTTNYDLFIEKAIEKINTPLILNDGFKRTPSLKEKFVLSPSEFFNIFYNTGNLYNYRVQIPSINLIKLHGSLNWQTEDKKIIQSLAYLKKLPNKEEDFINSFSLILPRNKKFEQTILDQTYYDLLRIYTNELDKENTLLIAEGFSFADEHILNLTKRALKNPTLILIIFCFKKNELQEFENKFSDFNNVYIVHSKTDIYFKNFNEILVKMLPIETEQQKNLSTINDVAADESNI